MKIEAVIFDVDGVLVASPHERAWREALDALMADEWRDLVKAIDYDTKQFTTGVYQEIVAGRPRLSGAQAVLERFGVPDAETRAAEYAARKQRRLEDLIEQNEFVAYPDALRFALELKLRHVRLAAASSSKNANLLMQRIQLDRFVRDEGLPESIIPPRRTLLDLFDANVSGLDLPRGKPDPLLFLLAAQALDLPPTANLVVEDAQVGIQAAKAGGMAALGVARFSDEALLTAASADLVVRTLDEVSVEALAQGRLETVLAETQRAAEPLSPDSEEEKPDGSKDA